MRPSEQRLLVYGRSWPAEMARLSRVFDLVIACALFLAVIAAFHLHVVLTVGDWDFWVDWKDRQYWVTVTPVLLITFPAAVSYILWENFRLPFGATFCALALALGQWIDRYLAFGIWANFPLSMVWPATIIPGALVLDALLLLTGNVLLTAILGGMAFGLLFPVANWPMLAAYRLPVEVMDTELASVGDLIGYAFVRTTTPEYLRIIERGMLRTLGGHSTTVSAFFSGFLCILMFLLWWYMGRALTYVVTIPNRLKTAMGL